MKDDIKEILDKLKDNDWYEELDLTKTKWIELKQEETNQLLDYITNLQEENERLKDIIKEAINYIDDNTYYKDHKGHINIDDVYIILQGSDKDD